MHHHSRWILALLPLAFGCESKPAPAPAPTQSASAAKPVASTATSAKPVDDVDVARELTKMFGGALKKELMTGMRDGPTNAIAVCNEKAPAIAETIDIDEGWSIRRTSLKLRNPKNAPDAWEKRMLEKMEADKKSGTAVAKLEVSEVVEGEFRYMKAIGTAAMCLTCHGPQLAPDVTKALAEKYPDDKAVGFAAGDIRGAFSVRKKL